MIELKNIHAGKGGRKLFENFSWTIAGSEHWVVSGSNGSGKSLLLEVLAGSLHIVKGEITTDFIFGNNWDERYADRKRKIHLIPAHAIQALLKQSQEHYYQQRYYDIGDERTPKVRDILATKIDRITQLRLPDSFDIGRLLELDLTRLSNGQLKKVLLIKVLLEEIPKMLLLDYPFEGLDILSRRDLCDLIDFIAIEHGVQIIIADHHDQLPSVMNRKLVIDDFRIQELRLLKIDHQAPASIKRQRESRMYSSDTVVDIRNLKIQYGHTVILDDFNWKIQKGERWALIGRNGAGKTTLFSMIFADHPMAYSQDIWLFGRKRGSGESIWDIKKRISYLGPELLSYLGPEQFMLTAKQYLKTVVRPWKENAFNELVGALNATSAIDKTIRILSSGELQIILVIACMMKDAEMLLLDEPFQFLDPMQKKNLNDCLRTHLRADQTLILITHYEEDLREWTDFTKRL